MPKNRLRAQLWNHLDWLESRGLTGSFPSAQRHFPNQPEPDSHFEPSQAIANGSPSPKPSLLGFFSNKDLRPAEQQMLTRIILALGFDPDAVPIASAASKKQDILLHCRYLVALGGASGQVFLPAGAPLVMHRLQPLDRSRQLLIIPHPSAMLLDPSLKLSAWAALQNLKLALIC